MTLVCGIDVGSLRTPSYVAWLREGEIVLDAYLASIAQPLPVPPPGLGRPAVFALDAPQGLPTPGRPRRVADAEARTPTSTLPHDRRELVNRKLYRGLVEAGVEIFWSVATRGLGAIAGSEPQGPAPLVCETYPRYVIRRLWPNLEIPSKRKAPLDFVEAVWAKLEDDGYRVAGVRRPTVDQVDAVLCARAAEVSLGDVLPAGTVGELPSVDLEERILREGLIVSP